MDGLLALLLVAAFVIIVLVLAVPLGRFGFGAMRTPLGRGITNRLFGRGGSGQPPPE
jgi:hypothetical protein